jgi:hypothetical protein
VCLALQGDRVEHTLEPELRAVDNLKQLGCSSLSLMRLAQLKLKLKLKLGDPASKVLLCPGRRYFRRHGIHPIV